MTGSIQYSSDGLNWTNASVGGFSDWGSWVAWNDGKWVAVGSNGGVTGSIQYSSDGIIWQNAQTGGFSLYGFTVTGK